MPSIPPPASVASPAKVSKRRWLIVAEDSKSSLLYFKGFPIDGTRLEVYPVGGAGDPQNVVQRAIDLRDHALAHAAPYAEVWAIFDRDDWPLDRFQAAFSKARSKGIRAIWTNEAFELWYVLHFVPRITAMGRAEYKPWLDQSFRLGKPYDKADPTIYSLLHGHQKEALKNADRLLAEYENSGQKEERRFPERQNPSTNVQKLVRELNEFLRPPLPVGE